MRRHWFIYLILIFSLILNLYGIKWGLPDKDHLHPSFHPDETSSVESSLSILSSNRFLYPSPTALGNGAMQFYIVALIYKIGQAFGLLKLSPSNAQDLNKLYLIGRFVTLIMSALMIFFFFQAIKMIFGVNTALLASFLLSALPGIVISSQYFRSEIPALFWIVLAFYFMTKIVQTKNSKFYLLAGMSVGFATSTKYNSLVIIILLIFAHILSLAKKERSLKRYFLDKKLIYSFLTIALTFIIGSPGILLYPGEFKERLFKQIFYYQKGVVIESTGMGPGWLGYFTQVLPYSLTLPIQVLSIIGLIWAFLKHRRWEIFLVIWTVLYYLAMSNANYWLVRYTIPLLPALSGIIANFIIDEPKQKSLKKFFLITGLIVALIATTCSLLLDSVRAAKDPRHIAYDWVRENIPANKKIGIELTPASFYNLAEDNENQTIAVHSGKSGIQLIFQNRLEDINNKYQSVVMGLSDKMLSQIDYYIANDQIYQHYLRVPHLFPVESRYFGKIFYSGLFTKIAEFENPIKLFNWRLPKGYPPHDYRYFLPTITIYQRVATDYLK